MFRGSPTTTFKTGRDGCFELAVFDTFTRRHGVAVVSITSVDECSIAAVSRMNNVTVIFLSTIDNLSEVVEKGSVVND